MAVYQYPENERVPNEKILKKGSPGVTIAEEGYIEFTSGMYTNFSTIEFTQENIASFRIGFTNERNGDPLPYSEEVINQGKIIKV